VSALAIACLLGCGYTLQHAPGALSDDAPRLTILTLDNDSGEPGLERLVTEALRQESLRRGQYRLVSDASSADWVVSGRVLPLNIVTRTLSSVVLALEQTVTLQVELALAAPTREGRASRPRPLPLRLLGESEIYFASADLEATRKNRTEALRRIAGLIAERVVDTMGIEVTQ